MIISILIAIMTENNTIETIAGFLTALGLVFAIGGKIVWKKQTN